MGIGLKKTMTLDPQSQIHKLYFNIRAYMRTRMDIIHNIHTKVNRIMLLYCCDTGPGGGSDIQDSLCFTDTQCTAQCYEQCSNVCSNF